MTMTTSDDVYPQDLDEDLIISQDEMNAILALYGPVSGFDVAQERGLILLDDDGGYHVLEGESGYRYWKRIDDDD